METLTPDERVKSIQEKIYKMKKKYDSEVAELNNKLDYRNILIGFYKFESLLISGTLPEGNKRLFDRNNFNNTRLNDIIKMRKEFEEIHVINVIPPEIKSLIRELM